jgi:hypothetical protein
MCSCWSSPWNNLKCGFRKPNAPDKSQCKERHHPEEDEWDHSANLLFFKLVDLKKKKKFVHSVFPIHVPQIVSWVWCKKLTSLYCFLQISLRVVFVSFRSLTSDSSWCLWMEEPVYSDFRTKLRRHDSKTKMCVIYSLMRDTVKLNLLKTKRNLLYIRNLSIPRCKHSLPRL